MLVPGGLFAIAKVVDAPTSPSGRILTFLTLAALFPLTMFLTSALMSHVQGAEPRLNRDA